MTLPNANVCIWSFNLPNNQVTLSDWNLASVNTFNKCTVQHEIPLSIGKETSPKELIIEHAPDWLGAY